MDTFIKQLIKDNILDKKLLLEYISKNPTATISLGQILDSGILDKESLYTYIAKEVRKGDIQFDEIELLNREGINLNELFTGIAKELNFEYIDLDNKEIDSSLLEGISSAILLKNKAVIVEEDDMFLYVVFSDPFNLAAQDSISRLFPKKLLKVCISQTSAIKDKLLQIETYEKLKSYVEEIKKDLATTADSDEDESPAVLKLIELILKNSIVARASDIHIEATEKNCIVRDRIDGMLQQSFILDRAIFGPLASRIKLLSGLDIAEQRKPQDGRFTSTVAGSVYDFRVSTLPTLIGESIVMRILDKSKTLITLEDMGMNDRNYKVFNKAISAPYGIVLVTGPTGSGKTTTLYAALNAIKSVKDKTITVEDPVEYQMNGIQQVQVNNNAGLTFAAALRSILRQDPDKIMIGEIRDNETLRIAIQAAMTGHLVLSTLHTNDAISAINRMIDMGIESYLVSGSLVAIQAQRLVRKICPYCKVEDQITSSVLNSVKEFIPEGREIKFYKGEGCKECYHTGYKGREMISEVLEVSAELSRMIALDKSKEELTKQAVKDGFITMFADGVIKALDGNTTIEEIFRVARL